MKDNKLSEGKNLLWESSRMMLPEHKVALVEHNRNKNVKPFPYIDEQQKEINILELMHSYTNRLSITLILYGEYEYRYLIGTVVKIDQIHNQFKINTKDDYEWIEFSNVVSVC